MKLIKNPDGTYTIQGAGWFWVRLSKNGDVFEMAPGMRERPAARQFLAEARKFLRQIVVVKAADAKQAGP
jgi:hypothetical protein